MYERVEKVRFSFEDLPAEKITNEQKARLESIIKGQKKVFKIGNVKGDVYSFNYDINISYFGNSLLYMLESINKFLDEKIVPKVNTKELIHGKCLIQDVLNKIEKIEKRLK